MIYFCTEVYFFIFPNQFIQMGNQLTAQHLKLGGLADSMDGVAVIDSAQNVLFWNAAMQRMTKLGEKQVIGQSLMACLPWLETRDISNKIAQALQGRGAFSIPFEVPQQSSFNGGTLQVAFSPLNTQTGRQVMLLFHASCMSDGAQAQEKPLVSNELNREQLFYQLFKEVPMGIVLLDQNQHVIQSNPGFEKIFGYCCEELQGKPLEPYIVPDEFIGQSLTINKKSRSGHPSPIQTIRHTKQGKEVNVSIYSLPFHENGLLKGLFGIYVDITNHKQLQDDLKTCNYELDNFVYKVSHDLRAPLSSILGLTYLAKHEENDKEHNYYIDLIENRAKELDRFINDVLSHSKNLNVEITNGVVDFKQLIKGCFEELDYMPNKNRVEWEANVSPHNFWSDEWRIKEILRNLISNAIKYINPYEENPMVRIDVDTDEQRAKIVFKDNGMGIRKEALSKVFNMFYRASESAEGSGIGLYIVKNAIDKIGGTIAVESKYGSGTTFMIEIPNQAPQPQHHARPNI